MATEERRRVIEKGARYLVAAALGALALSLGLRRGKKTAGYCDRAGRCGGCQVTDDCGVYRDTHGGPRP